MRKLTISKLIYSGIAFSVLSISYIILSFNYPWKIVWIPIFFLGNISIFAIPIIFSYFDFKYKGELK